MKKGKLRNSLGTDTDFAFNDLEICKQNLNINMEPVKKSKTTRTVVRGNMFYQKPTTTQLLRIRAKGSQPSLNLMRTPSLQKNHKFQKRVRQGNQSFHEEESCSNVMRRCISDSEIIPMHSFFESNSLLVNKHDMLVQNITALPQSLKMQLYTNQYEVQKCIETQMSPKLDQTLIFTMFNTLHDLEKKILDPLFQKGNPVLNFKIKYLSEAIECVSDLVLMGIRRACKVDIKLGIFLENFWKFWVILIDVTMQWLDKSCSDYIEYQVQQFKSQFKEAVKQKNTIEDQLMELQKELKNKELQHLHKIENMNQEILGLQQEFNDYKITIHQMSDLKQAEQRMNSVGLRALELESVFKQYDRALLQSRVGFQKDFSSLGNAIIQQKKVNQQLTAFQEKQLILKCSKAIEDQSLAVYVSIHPFLMCIDNKSPELLNSDMVNQEILHQFLDHLTTLDELNDNLCRVFKGWLNDPDKGNQVLRYILDADIEMPFIELFCIIFGIKEYTQLSHLSVRQIMNNYRQLQQENEWTIYEQINTKEYLPYLELLLPEDFMEKFRTTDKLTFTLEELLLLLAKHFHNKENKQWTEYIAKGYIDSEEYDHDLIDTYLEIKSQLNKGPLLKQQLEEAIKQIRALTLTCPQLFCKSKRTALAKIQLAVRRVSQATRGSSQRNSPIKRQSTYKAKK